MRKYIRRTSLVNHMKIFIITILMAVCFFGVWLFTEFEHIKSIGAVLILVLVSIELISIFSTLHRYSYQKEAICMEYLGVIYKKIKYEKIESIIISKGSYNNSFGYLTGAPIPIRFKNKKTPYITLRFKENLGKELYDCMYSRDIHCDDIEGTYSLGICWKESLFELFEHCNVKIFITKEMKLILEKEFEDINELIDRQGFCIVE